LHSRVFSFYGRSSGVWSIRMKKKTGYGLAGMKSKAPGGYGTMNKGYRMIWDRDDKLLKFEHRIAWQKANGPITKDTIIYHKNGNKLDNRIENLGSMTRSERSKMNRKPNRGFEEHCGVMMKTCVDCKELKNKDSFYANRDNYQTRCKPCYKVARWEKRQKGKEENGQVKK